MKHYIKNNLTPLVIGACAGLTFSMIVAHIENIIVKIALIYAP